MDCLSILGNVPSTMEETLAGLRLALDSDGVHFTDFGRQNWFNSMSDSMARILGRRDRKSRQEDAAVIISGGVHTWHGFTSLRGSR